MATHDFIKANYLPQKISEYIGNPMIEALPPIFESEQDVVSALKCVPKVSKTEKMESNLIKAHVLQRAKQLFIPLPIHLRLESSISVLIRSSYVYRNPISANFKKNLIELDDLKSDSINEQIPEVEKIIPASNPAQCIFVNGLSGMGKTTIIQKILNLYPQVISHTDYNGKLFTRTQIVWLKIDCPHDGSFITLCRSIFQKIDQLTGERYEEKYGYLTRSVSTMLMHLTHLLAIYNVGVLVIDEIQTLLNSKDDTSQMLDFFVTLTNTIYN